MNGLALKLQAWLSRSLGKMLFISIMPYHAPSRPTCWTPPGGKSAMASFSRQYVWTGPSGGGFSDFHNWTPVFQDQLPPSDNDLVIFNSGGALSIDGQNGVVAEIDVVLGTTLTLQNGLEATGTVNGVALDVNSGGVVIVGSGGEMIGM